MRFEGTLDIAAPRDRVWAFLTDPRRVTACAPDLQRLEVTDPEHFMVVVRAGVGSIKSTFTMRVTFTELRAPEYAALQVRGQAPGSALDMRNVMELSDAPPGRTMMRWSSEVAVTGMIASLGARLMQGAADKTTQQVFACIKEKLEAPGPPPSG